MKRPLVTVICLCYNHEQFLEEAVTSVLNQTYANIEVIIVDDYSTDNSVDLIQELKNTYPEIRLILHDENRGNCKSFNEALAVASGKYVIDFATDDIMLPSRIQEQCDYFESLPDEYGVVYSNSQFINEKGELLNLYAKECVDFPVGDVFEKVLRRHVYEPSSMMVRTDFFREIGGYNEDLSYEDFDFVLRSSRHSKVGCIDKVLTKRRKVEGSLSTHFLALDNHKMLLSTFLVCKEVYPWCVTEKEKEAWFERVKHESFFALRRRNAAVVKMYVDLLSNKRGLFFEKLVLRLYLLFS